MVQYLPGVGGVGVPSLGRNAIVWDRPTALECGREILDSSAVRLAPSIHVLPLALSRVRRHHDGWASADHSGRWALGAPRAARRVSWVDARGSVAYRALVACAQL